MFLLQMCALQDLESGLVDFCFQLVGLGKEGASHREQGSLDLTPTTLHPKTVVGGKKKNSRTL